MRKRFKISEILSVLFYIVFFETVLVSVMIVALNFKVR